MNIDIIAYPPGAGGNHLKNIIELSGRYQDQWPWPWVREQTVGLRPYDDPQGPPGEVHSLPGRNIHRVFIEHIDANPGGCHLLHGHFGELAPYAASIRSWANTRWLVVSMDDDQDRTLLRQRQNRLEYHPYWEDEEQIFLYQPDMYLHYFGATPGSISLLPIRYIWEADINRPNGMLDILQSAFAVDIDRAHAQILHAKWRGLNFGTA